MTNNDANNISDARADENLDKQPYDPILRNAGIVSKVRISKAVDVLSQVIAGLELGYTELLDVVNILFHFYENEAEIRGVAPEDLAWLPPILGDEHLFGDGDD